VILEDGSVGTIVRRPQRLRQSSKPLMNKLEQEWFEHLKAIKTNLNHGPLAQAVKFRLANGLTYCPDMFSFDWSESGELERPTAWEVKGEWFPEHNIAKLKMFAHEYPEIRVILVWRDKETKVWREQRIIS
jgi:hypothetical protein